MAPLHNRVNRNEMKERLYAETEPRTTFSFYRYFDIPDPKAFRDQLYEGLSALDVFGRVYVAKEGINGQASVPASKLESCRAFLYATPGLDGLRLNVAVDNDGKSFWVLKIKVRDKIVADGIDDPDFSVTQTGHYVDARRFNELAADPDTVLIDMRNHYEYEVGHFDGALEVPSDTFREQLPMAVDMLKGQEDKNIIMYCTGGIRCEKASAWMLHKGFRNVFHLEGGIIEYTNKARAWGLPNRFKGKNFVFDDRMGERISDDVIARCHQCGEPCDTHTNCANDGCHLLFIQCPRCAEAYKGCCSEACRDGELPEKPSLPHKSRKRRPNPGTKISI
ncbi:MAG TPA: rhodanese-related sulfurtransferase [Dinghuibacter sp.]|uniref:oxygen-dependent tRNA uridine(34) hydroxylase TrhO n=1 Tax=Dinghuibacter sp. TaxID=2024697 RepID=UPI002CC307DD|nr:rhodanese-related sulfurtransferase [Dinghuibacter sp.]HTJ14521.1 rhodanese-related sulfurtransferase [Dinghuibacter sp.]